MEGYVYCFTNPSMPNLCKCGGTKRDPLVRCKELFTTSLPVECKVEYSLKVNDWKEAEKIIHNQIIKNGFNRCKGREWFKCNPDDIKFIFDNYERGEYVKENIKDIIDDVKIDNSIDKKIVVNKNITVNNIKIINNKYYCKACEYETNTRFNMSHHKKTKKHIQNIEELKKEEERDKEMNLEKDKQIETLKQKLIESETKNKQFESFIQEIKKLKIINTILEKENEKLKDIIKIHEEFSKE